MTEQYEFNGRINGTLFQDDDRLNFHESNYPLVNSIAREAFDMAMPVEGQRDIVGVGNENIDNYTSADHRFGHEVANNHEASVYEYALGASRWIVWMRAQRQLEEGDNIAVDYQDPEHAAYIDHLSDQPKAA